MVCDNCRLIDKQTTLASGFRLPIHTHTHIPTNQPIQPNSPHQGFILRALPLEYANLDELPAPQTAPEAAAATTTPHWLALDEVWDPQNLGALLRSAYFLGMQVSTCVCGARMTRSIDPPTNHKPNHHNQPTNKNRASSSAPRTRPPSRPPSPRPAPARWSSSPSTPRGTWSASWSAAGSRATGYVRFVFCEFVWGVVCVAPFIHKPRPDRLPPR